MTVNFFISYAREDADYARALVARLTDLKWTVWMDEKDIPPSVPWMDEIQRSINESMLVIAIESSDWLSSDACHIEVGLAEQGRVPIIRIDTDPDRLEAHVAEVIRAYNSLPAWRSVSLGAASSAAIWDKGGRKKSLLRRGSSLSAMRREQRLHPADFSPTSSAFITASVHAANRRIVQALVIGFVVPALVVTTWISVQVASTVNDKVAQNVADSTAFAQRNAYYDWNTYAGLERASSKVSTFSHYRELFIDMTDRTPTSWTSTPVKKRGPLSAASPDSRSSAVADGATVVVTDATGSIARLPAPAKVTSIAWSPDSRWLAVASIDGAEVVSVDNAQVIPLRGGSGTTTSIRWDDTRHVSVGGSKGTGTWQVLDGTATTALSGVRYGTTIGGVLYSVNSAGVVSTTNTSTGATKSLSSHAAKNSSPVAIDSAAGEVVVAFNGPHPYLRVIDTKTHASREVSLGVCSPLGLSLTTNGNTAYLACSSESANETRVDLASGAVTSKPYQNQFAYGVRALDDRVLWGGVFGGVYQSGLDLTPRGLLTSAAGCGAPTRKFVGPSDGSQLFAIGDGTGSFACAPRIKVTSGAQVNRFLFAETDGHAAPDAALSANGSLIAYGLSDGRVRVFATDTFDPLYFAQVLPDQVRAISFSTDGKSLIVAGLSGQVVTVRLPYTTSAAATKALPAEALTRLKNAVKWGIYVPTLGSTPSPTPGN